MSVIIPVLEYPFFIEDVTLDGNLYSFQFSWNSRGRFWTLTILDKAESILIAGIKVVLNYELLRVYRGKGLPRGGLVAVDEKGISHRIEWGNLGDTITLVYMTEDELAAL
jgi:hypothetical protein